MHACVVQGRAADTAACVQGEIPTIAELPLPWGKKPYQATAAEASMGIVHYPADSSPAALRPMAAA